MLRAFSLFFQLANIAEQHHRLRRRRQYEHEGRVPRESLADAVARLRDAGVGDEELLEAAARLAGRARPDRAPDRGDAPHDPRRRTSGSQRALRRLDDPELPPSDAASRPRIRSREEVTMLWQTDEVRSRRPRVVDEIRHGLWFFEQSLWQALPRLVRELQDAIPGAPPPAPVRHAGSAATWTATRTPAPRRSPTRSSARGTLARDLLRQEVRELGSAWGMSTTSSSARSGARSSTRRATSPTATSSCGSGSGSPRTSYRDADELAGDLARIDASLRAHGAARVADGALADLRARVEVFGLHLAKLDVRVHAKEVRERAERVIAALRGRGARRASGTGRARSTA